jgi:hypothetical protein
MSDSIPTPPSTSVPIAYRPISGFAIAGFVAGCAFALLMLAMAVVALLQGAPFFLSPWILVAPAAGAVLSLVARGQIRGSEGTQAGERLAGWGIAMSVFTGLGYGVYYLVTGLAVTSQANAFLMDNGADSGFFPHLQKSAVSRSDFNAAFLLTLPAGSRGNVRPEDDAAMQSQYDLGQESGPGLMTRFRQNLLTRQFHGGSGAATVEPLGVQYWDHKEGSYEVTRTYRIKSAEAVSEFTLVARSNEGEAAGEQRKWFVDLKMIPQPSVKLTALGVNVLRLSTHSQGAVDKWRNDINAGNPFDFPKADKTDWQRLALAVSQRTYARERLTQMLEGTQTNRLQGLQLSRDDQWPEWEAADGKMRLDHPFRINLEPRGSEPPYTLDGRLTVESATRVDPADEAVEPEWIVRSIVITRAAPMTKKGPPGSKGGP